MKQTKTTAAMRGNSTNTNGGATVSMAGAGRTSME